MRYYIADTHFFHAALNDKMDMRGFKDVEEMNNYIIEQWNKKVKKKDEVVILGDFSWGNEAETKSVLDRLNGRLYLVTGNHDRAITNSQVNSSRFGWIRPYTELSDNGRKVVLCHYPIMFYNGQYKFTKNGKPGTYMLYGHVHDTDDQRMVEDFQDQLRNHQKEFIDGTVKGMPCNMINCFCMYSDYVPLSLDEWIELTAKRHGGQH